ncbi:MAG: hypothetical protein AAFV53_37175 [Myxococcota bacterium]
METTSSGPNWSSADRSPLQPLELAGIELNQLSRYVFVAMLVGLCAMLSAWSRIDLRETAYALDHAQTAHAEALAERARLELELASLVDPHWLSGAAGTLSLESVEIVDVDGQATAQ